ncbi:MAG TPA: OB-fold domain-containing protein [Acidimicrobiales bacterium]|nr:OB-fold domain-containing protein [Acidimicrobiales bacterium]
MTRAADTEATEILRKQLPLPGWSDLTAPYWQHAAEGRLVIQRCRQCGVHRWEPVEICYACHSWDWDWDPVGGAGTVYTYTWADMPREPGADLVNLAVVELDGTEGDPVRLLTWVEGADRESLRCGLPVQVAFDPLGDGLGVPYFRPRSITAP